MTFYSVLRYLEIGYGRQNYGSQSGCLDNCSDCDSGASLMVSLLVFKCIIVYIWFKDEMSGASWHAKQP